MINLDLDYAYLSSRYHIGSRDMQRYKNMSIVQIMQVEAAKGNSAAAEFLMHITNNPKELAKVLKLVDPKNRYLILMNMNENDLMMIMQFLEPEELILGLSIFNQDALIELMQQLPPETLQKVVLSKMDSEKFLKLIPEEYLNEFFASDNIDRSMIMKGMENIDKEQLQKMMENFTGQPCYDDSDTILQSMNKLNDDNFMKAVLCCEPKGKQQIIGNMLREKPDLFQEFSPEAMTHPFKTMPKEEILKSLSVLETKEMLPMIENMPQEIMALVATQIDPQVFAKILCSNFAEVLANCGMNLG